MTDASVLIRQLQGVIRRGDGSPEGVLDAPAGVLYQRSDGVGVAVLYVKTTDAGTLTGWSVLA